MRFALTFDDGAGPSTPALLDVLGGVRATFFLLGRNVAESPWTGTVERLAREGHVLGNHTYSHLRPARFREFAADARRGRDALARWTHAPPFRLPYGIVIENGALDPRVPVLASLGWTHTHWTSDFEDWTLREGDGPRLAARMIAHVQECETLGQDAVLDLHDSGTGSSFGYERPATVDGVRLLLEEAARRGWTPFTVPEGA